MKPMSEVSRATRLLDTELTLWGFSGREDCGIFAFLAGAHEVHVIASSGDGWDHVSVACEDRIPSWLLMEAVKRLFFKDDETAMQLHVPPKEHINDNPNVLHLWRPTDVPIPRPPAIMV